MYIDGLVFGVLDTSNSIANHAMATRLRSLTLSWCRFGYRDVIIEDDCVNAILDEALACGYKYCFIQAYGHLIGENWYPDDKDFQTALKDRIETHDFFVTGHIVGGDDLWYGLRKECLLVNLEDYQAFGRPAFDRVSNAPVEIVKPTRGADRRCDDEERISLRPSDEVETCVPQMSGWNFVHVSLKNGKTVYNFDQAVSLCKLNLCSEANSLLKYIDRGIFDYDRHAGDDHLSDNHRRFFSTVDLQTKNARHGVFIWNLESYADVEHPPPEFVTPVSTLYSVASGFKPNRILHTHGFNAQTRVVFFDYSPNALEIKKSLHEEWDGEDYPRFVKYLFEKYPHPDTYYNLWNEITPDQVNWDDMYRYWENEIEKWGGEQVIKDHWAAYKQLEHVYVPCNILTEQDALLAQMRDQPNSVIWWSNAFFTVYSNWFYTIDQRKQMYGEWISTLATANPGIFIYGSDYNNTCVNFIQAGAYSEQYSQFGTDYLRPYKLHKHEIRL